jgi:hypothetical protein
MSRSRKTRGRVVGATAGELHPNAAVGAKGLAALARNVHRRWGVNSGPSHAWIAAVP